MTGPQQTGAPAATPQGATTGFDDEVTEFSSHCAYIRTVFRLTVRIWRDSTDDERDLMEKVSPSFFLDMGQVLAEYVVLAACRMTDPANGGKNFTIEYFVDSFSPNSTTFQQLEQLEQTMYKLRDKIKPARNKLIAHADRNAIRKGVPLGYATWQEWDEFWSALTTFVRVLNEKVLGTPYEIDIAGVPGDAEMLLKALRQGRHFETLLASKDKNVQDAALTLALPPTG